MTMFKSDLIIFKAYKSDMIQYKIMKELLRISKDYDILKLLK